MTAPTVTLAQGRLRGVQDRAAEVFRRIPYAANPFLPATRFLAPQPPPTWPGERDATQFGPVPPQPDRTPAEAPEGAPDDLCLNIWKPLGAGPFPVMVYIPGGAYFRVDAGDARYDGQAFARDGVLLVTLNYRVAADGFLPIPGCPDNRGHLDQLAALRWVRDHIAAFGGDPGNVTVFGQSAGAGSIATLMGSTNAEPLFHRAILQSRDGTVRPRADSVRIAEAFAARLGVHLEREALAAISHDRFIQASTEMRRALTDHAIWGRLANQLVFQTVLEPALVPEQPVVRIRAGAARHIPIITGMTDDEYRLFHLLDGSIDRLTWADCETLATDCALAPGAVALYRANHPGCTPGDVHAALMGDMIFRVPTTNLACAQQQAGGHAWLYHFGWRGAGFGGRLGAAHNLDVSFVFETYDTGRAQAMVGPDAPRSLGAAMHQAWVAFARSGHPGWPEYDPAAGTAKYFTADPPRLVGTRDAAERALWPRQDV
jgi:para-nitrobenzyl esterase